MTDFINVTPKKKNNEATKGVVACATFTVVFAGALYLGKLAIVASYAAL